MQRELNVLALVKGEERYVFVYEEESRDNLIDTFRQWAADPDLSLTWFDAAVLTEKARLQAQQPKTGVTNRLADRIAEV